MTKTHQWYDNTHTHTRMHLSNYRRAPFFEGYKFCKWTKKESLRKNFQESYISLQSAIHVMIGFSIIFCETNFVEVRKSMKSAKLQPLKRHPTVVQLVIKCQSATLQQSAIVLVHWWVHTITGDYNIVLTRTIFVVVVSDFSSLF